MRLALKAHPDSRGSAVTRVEAEIARPHAGTLALSYFANGDIGALRVPPAAAAVRADGLWQHTCFEAFVRTLAGASYYEFNFAPSTQWAAYRFDGYRNGMRAAEMDDPGIRVRSEPDCYILQASLDLDRINLSHNAHWQLGLSAVIEEKDGGKSYWALAHPAGKPDFHHSDCFACEFS